MSSCYQHGDQTILQHGEAVAERYTQLISGITSGWRLPDWFIKHGQELIKLTPSADVMEQYHIYHDCGKPFCRQVDEQGRQHFPNHAAVSAGIWRVYSIQKWHDNGTIFPKLFHSVESCHKSCQNGLIGHLIQHDMDMHTMKPAEASAYDRLDLAPALLLTALSEIHANAEMFGGITSESFCIKWKRLYKLGNAFTPLLLKEQS